MVSRREALRVQPLLPAYMTMGQDGMAEMGEMGGPHGYISMGGMFTLLKVREGLTSYADPGFYKSPAAERADLASEAELKRDGIKI